MSREYMKAFREARTSMGFVHTSAYVPSSRIAEFSLFVDRLKAERMLEICDVALPTSRERIALAGRNVMELPTIEDARAVATRHPNQPAINRQVAALVDRLEKANSSMNVAKMENEEEGRIKWMSWAVAHNHMANVLWRELSHAAKQLEHRNG